jgi:hypothetical protein
LQSLILDFFCLFLFPPVQSMHALAGYRPARHDMVISLLCLALKCGTTCQPNGPRRVGLTLSTRLDMYIGYDPFSHTTVLLLHKQPPLLWRQTTLYGRGGFFLSVRVCFHLEWRLSHPLQSIAQQRAIGLGIRSIRVIRFGLFEFLKFRVLKNENRNFQNNFRNRTRIDPQFRFGLFGSPNRPE